MDSYKFVFLNLSFFILLLSLSVSFAHKKPKTGTPCPNHCVCTCPPSPGQSPPTQGAPPQYDQNQPPPTQGSPPPENQSQPPTSQGAPPPENQSQPPPSQGAPPPENQNQPPPSQGAPPPNDQNQPPPSQGAPPPENQSQPPPSQGAPPSNDQNQPPPSQGAPPPENQSQPPPSQGAPPPENQNQPPPSQGAPPPENQSQPPPSQGSPPPENQSQPPTSQGAPPPSGQDNAPPPTQQNTSPPSGQGYSPPPAQQNASPPPSQGSSPPSTPQYGQAPPSNQNPSPGTTTGGSFGLNASFKGYFKKVFAFGDSFTDTGNAFLSGGLKSFIGGSYSTAFSGQRMSNGRLVIDFLCDALDLPPLPAYKKSSANFSGGCNFAISGSTSLSADFFAGHKISHTLMWNANPMSFQTQIDWFNNFLTGLDCKGKSDADCKAEMGNTLFWIGELGGNDYSRIFGTSIQIHWLTELAVSHVCKIVKSMVERGAKYLVVQGLPPVGCCPLELALRGKDDRDSFGCSSVGNAMVMAHNDLLQRRLADIQKQYGGCMIVYADTWNAYKTILTNYKKFGFAEPFKACCGAGGGSFNFDLHSLCGSTGTSTCKNPQQYISWDGIHLTEAMHRHLAELFFQGGYCRPSFDELIKAKAAHHTAH